MSALRYAAWCLCIGAALVAACEQDIVVVDRDGGGGEGGLLTTGESVSMVSSSGSVSTGGVIADCGDAPGPQGDLVACVETTSAAVSTGVLLCERCVADTAGNQYVTECNNDACTCKLNGAAYCGRTAEEVPACAVSACPYPWNAQR